MFGWDNCMNSKPQTLNPTPKPYSPHMVPDGPAAASGVIEVGDTLVPDGPVLSEYGTHLFMPSSTDCAITSD